jgi:hypothetical protein
MSADPRIDEYIADAEPFARPILKAFRAAVHAGCPEAVETIKWQFPFFDYKGPLCTMAAFKAHVRLVFWNSQPLAAGNPAAAVAVVALKRVTALDQLPKKADLVALVKAAVVLNDLGVKGPIARRKDKKADPRPSPEFLAALAKAPNARKAFEAFPPSHKREYIEWIDGAKRQETRARRIAQAIEQLRAGKSMNWKYQQG